jgi:hypothetical protein
MKKVALVQASVCLTFAKDEHHFSLMSHALTGQSKHRENLPEIGNDSRSFLNTFDERLLNDAAVAL